ncbi:MAG: EI24 domain-containing protein [Chloroflexi bacterium SZAS-1]|jgi:CysZ protein|nr:EI24 domain-containing protein [Chloroflexi bacterium SZAS-1]
MIQALIAGLAYPFRALGLLARTRRLWGYVLIPILVNMLVGATLYAALLFTGLRAIDGAVATLPAWAALFGSLLRVLLIVLLFIATGFVLVRFGVVLGAPWYARLSEQLELMQRGVAPEQVSGVAAALRDLSRALLFELKKLLLVLVVGGILLLLNLIPGVGQVLATAGGIVLGATIACLDFLDYPLERRLLSFRQKLGVIRRALPSTAGFGLVALGLVSIPFLNLLAIPLCVTAGTLLFCEQIGESASAR